KPFLLARDGDVEHLVDAHLQADRRARAGLEAPLPFAHRGDEDRGHGGRIAAGERAVEFLQRLARPEELLEAVHLPPDAAVEERLVDDDRPAPHRSDEKTGDDDLHDDVGLKEKRDQRDIAGRNGEDRGGYVLNRHCRSSRSVSAASRQKRVRRPTPGDLGRWLRGTRHRIEGAFGYARICRNEGAHRRRSLANHWRFYGYRG